MIKYIKRLLGISKPLTASEAIELLNPIPEEDFITYKFSDGIGKCCAIGHLTRLKSRNPKDYSKNNCSDWGKADVSNFVRDNVRNYIKDTHGINYTYMSEVNNTEYINGYNEPTPKQRVLHLLEDMKKAGY